MENNTKYLISVPAFSSHMSPRKKKQKKEEPQRFACFKY